MLLPPVDKIVENVTGKKPVQEERTDTHTVFKKGEAPKVYESKSKRGTEIKPSGNCSSQWTKKHYTKQGPVCFNTCNEKVSCN